MKLYSVLGMLATIMIMYTQLLSFFNNIQNIKLILCMQYHALITHWLC